MGLSRKLSRQRGRTAGKNLRINEGELFGYISKPIDAMGFPLVVQECCEPGGPLPQAGSRLPSRSRLEPSRRPARPARRTCSRAGDDDRPARWHIIEPGSESAVRCCVYALPHAYARARRWHGRFFDLMAAIPSPIMTY